MRFELIFPPVSIRLRIWLWRDARCSIPRPQQMTATSTHRGQTQPCCIYYPTQRYSLREGQCCVCSVAVFTVKQLQLCVHIPWWPAAAQSTELHCMNLLGWTHISYLSECLTFRHRAFTV